MRRLEKIFLAVLMGAMLLPILFSATTPSASATSENWWNSSWSYRAPITLTVHPDNYQIKIVLDKVDNLHSHCLDNFQDVRFTENDNGPELNFWIENYIGGDNAIFWVRRVENDAPGDNQIYVYYGKSDATSVSNGANTFLFFDDFPGASLDTSKWEGDTENVVVSSGIATLSGTEKYIHAKPNQSLPFVGESRSMISNTSLSHASIGLGDVIRAYGVQDNGVCYYQKPTPEIYSRVANVWYLKKSGISASLGMYQVRKFISTSSNIKIYFNDILEHEITTNVPTVAQNHWFKSYTNLNVLIDWAFVRKYVSPEPTASVGDEESTNTPPTTPTTLTLNSPKVGENLTATASGSTDNDNDSITYYYRFINQTDNVERKAYSTGNTYTIAVADAHDNIRVLTKAYDGYENSSEKENSIIVSNTPPTIPTNFTDLEMNLTDHTPPVTWTKGADGADGDTVTTYVYVGTTSTPTTVENTNTGTGCDLGNTVTLSDGTIYYYRLRSWDNYEWSSYTTADEFSMASVVTYTLTTFVAAGSGSINPSGTTIHDIGDNVAISASASSGYAFDHWIGDLTSSQNPTSIIMNDNKTAGAYFVATAPLPPPPSPAVGMANINIFFFILGFVFLLFGPLVGIMAMRNGNPGLGLAAIIMGPTIGSALLWTAI